MNKKRTAVPEYANNLLMPGTLPEAGDAMMVSAESIGEIITELMRPVMQTVGKLLENNTTALQQLSAAQSVQNDRLEALEKQIRLQTPVTGKQVSYLNEAIRLRARELLEKRGIENTKATVKLSNKIRKAVLSRYGISSVREIPKHEYNVAMSQIETWNNLLTVRDVVKEWKDDGSSELRGGDHEV